MSYTVGNLELNIQTFSNDSAKNLDNKGYFKSDYSNITIEMDRQKVGQLVAKPSYSEMRRTNIMRK